MVKLPFALILCLGVFFASPVHGATISRSSISHGVANCRGARLSDESVLRRSPMGITNTGDKPVFVTCDFDQGPNWPNYESVVGISSVTIAFLNPTGTNVTVNCTLADGILHVANYFPKATVVEGGPGAPAAVPTWTSEADNGGKLFAAPALSCTLPKGIEISYLLVLYFEEIGQ
jgi:hypothetical protein